jgi:hypothetical protein
MISRRPVPKKALEELLVQIDTGLSRKGKEQL